MVTKTISRSGRPRRFAPEQAVSAAKVLFHQKVSMLLVLLKLLIILVLTPEPLRGFWQ